MNLKWNTAILMCLWLFNNNFIYAGSRFRIFGGKEASIEDHPWIVSLQVPSLGHWCGGSLISEEWVITAAHCFMHENLKPESIIAGTSNLTGSDTTIKIENVIIHEKFRPRRFYDYDIAIVKLAEKVTFSDKIQPINLPEQDAEVRISTSLTVAGWGLTKLSGRASDVLMKTTVTVTRHCSCMKTIIAAYDRKSGICKGDSGGPLQLNGTLVGVVSGSGPFCGSRLPAIYTNVALFRTWIKEKTGI